MSLRVPAFLIALMMVAANLRPSLTGVGPLLKTIQQQLSMSATVAGLLNSLPLLMFAAAAPLAKFATRHGAERLMLAALVALAGGILIRSEGHVATLFAGTVILASGIAVANILVPILIKQRYPGHVAGLTTAYATVMAGMAGVASGVAVPLASVLPGGWLGALGCWVLPALLAIALWLPHVRPASHVAVATANEARRVPWGSALAWQVTAFMGLQSTVFYTTITWFPAVATDAGFDAETAGWLLMLYQLVGIVAGLAIPPLIRRLPDQRMLALGCSLFAAAGTLGMLLLPKAALLWSFVMGCGAGPCLILGLTFMGLRAHDGATAAALSLMAQALGYLLAAMGPVAFGSLHDMTASWGPALLCLAGASLVQGLCGLGAGRLRTV